MPSVAFVAVTPCGVSDPLPAFLPIQAPILDTVTKRLGCLLLAISGPTCSRFQTSAFSHKQTLALPKEVEHWSPTTLREKLVKVGAKVVRHGRYHTFFRVRLSNSRLTGGGRLPARPATVSYCTPDLRRPGTDSRPNSMGSAQCIMGYRRPWPTCPESAPRSCPCSGCRLPPREPDRQKFPR